MVLYGRRLTPAINTTISDTLNCADKMVYTAKTFLLTNGLVALLYLFLGGLSFSAALNFNNITNVVFAPAGVWLAVSLLFGPKAAVFGILIGQTLLSFYAGPSVIGGISIALFNTFSCFVGHHLFIKWKINCQFSTFRDTILFIILIVLVIQPISTTGSILTLVILGAIPLDIIPMAWQGLWIQGIQQPLSSLTFAPNAWLNWWLGGVMGQLLIAPLILTWLRPAPSYVYNKKIFNTLELVGSALVIGVIAFITLSNISFAPSLVLVMTYPLLIWLGLRYGVRYTALINVIIALFIIILSAFGYGFINYFNVKNKFYYISFFIITTTSFSLILFSMFEERRNLINQLKKLATVDFLTNLYNRRFFLERAEEALAQTKRYQQTLSIAILDIDHFKQINDQYGHAAGDHVLKEISYLCKKFLRKHDIIGRFGGEEFALLFPNTTLTDAKLVVDRLLEFVSQCKIQIDVTTTIQITFSAGVAELDFNTDQSVNDTLNRADKMLYVAKKSGRNQVHVFNN